MKKVILNNQAMIIKQISDSRFYLLHKLEDCYTGYYNAKELNTVLSCLDLVCTATPIL